MEDKRGFVIGEYLVWWIIAIVVLILLFIIIFFFTDRGSQAIDYLKEVLKLGR